MTLHDQHLQQALHCAPDRELSPSDMTRHAVFTYASQALKPRHASRLTQLRQLLHHWHVSRWQLASMGSVVATLLVVVVFWHERPDDTVWGTSVPMVLNESAVDALLSQDFAKNQKTDTMPQERSLVKELSEKSSQSQQIVSGVKSPQTPNKDTENKAQATTVVESAITASKDIANAKSNVHASKQKKELAALDVGKMDGDIEAIAATPSPIKEADKLADAREQVKKAKNSSLTTEKLGLKGRASDSVAEDAAIPAATIGGDGNGALALAISKEGGKVIANKDIGRGVLRQLYLGQYSTKLTPECDQLQTIDIPTVNQETGYRVEVISACYATARLIQEVDIYNQTMREWHDKGGH